MRDVFDPEDIRQEDLNKIAETIETYVDTLTDVMVIPDNIMDECEDKIKEGIKRARKLIKRLRKGDKSVFKDADEWNFIY